MTVGLPWAKRLFTALLSLHICVLVYMLSQPGGLIATAISVSFFMFLAYKFYVGKERKVYFLLVEKITPFVYCLYVLFLII